MTKAFADTNLFLRFLTRDIPEQADAVKDLITRANRKELVLVTTAMVFAELVWTLSSFYKLDKTQIKTMLLAIINTPGIEVEERDRVIQALVWFEEKNLDFIDAYHAAWLIERPFKRVITFDKKHFQRFGHLDLEVPGDTS